MKKPWKLKMVLLILLTVILVTGCSGVKGYSYENGVFTRTKDGRNILVADNGYYFLMNGKTSTGEERELFSKLEVGDIIRIKTACVPYVAFADNEYFCVINVYDVQKKLFKHKDITEETMEKIEIEFNIDR